MCRAATTAAVASLTACFLPLPYALLAAAALTCCPRSCLWWAPKAAAKPSRRGVPATSKRACKTPLKQDAPRKSGSHRSPSKESPGAQTLRVTGTFADLAAARGSDSPVEGLTKRQWMKRLEKMPKARRDTVKTDAASNAFDQALKFYRENGALPQRTDVAGRVGERRLAMKVTHHRADKSKLSPKALEHLAQIEEIEQHEGQAGAERGSKKTSLIATVCTMEEQLVKRHDDWCALRQGPRRGPQLQRRPGPGMTFAGENAYPGFSNLGNTCFLNAVFQCLLHCAGPRHHLLALAPGLVDSPDRDLRVALRQAAEESVWGLPLEGIDKSAKFDVYSASNLVDTFIAAEPQFVLGERHDACEALQCMLEKMQDFRALFAVDNTQALAEVIYLRGFDDASDVWSLEKFLQDDVSKVVTMCVARNSRLAFHRSYRFII